MRTPKSREQERRMRKVYKNSLGYGTYRTEKRVWTVRPDLRIWHRVHISSRGPLRNTNRGNTTGKVGQRDNGDEKSRVRTPYDVLV